MKTALKGTARSVLTVTAWFAAAAVARAGVYVADKYVIPAVEAAIQGAREEIALRQGDGVRD